MTHYIVKLSSPIAQTPTSIENISVNKAVEPKKGESQCVEMKLLLTM